MEFFDSLIQWMQMLLRKLETTVPFGAGTPNLLAILVGFVVISIVISVFWKGGRG